MSNLMFFCIPAHGHVNPTLAVAAELVKRGHRVRYYSFPEFQERIVRTGAEYISCEEYLPPAPKDLDKKAGRDFAALIEMVADTTVALDQRVADDIREFSADCIISDSVCFWGKLFAKKYRIPLICSTTTMAFNQYTARMMKRGPGEFFRMLVGMPRIQAKMKLLKEKGYLAENLLSLLQNDNDTCTIVYTSRKFQPMAETFSEKYAFVGPSVEKRALLFGDSVEKSTFSSGISVKKEKTRIYISLGTVLNRQTRFYRNCIEALKTMDCQAVISVGRNTKIEELGKVPEHIQIYPYVDQLAVLADTDVFLTHCGMNSVNESLYQGVPMVLYPQHSEENAVALRVEQLGAGVRLQGTSVKAIKRAFAKVLSNKSYRQAAKEMAEDFHACGGPAQAADFIEAVTAAKEPEENPAGAWEKQ